MKLSTKSRYAIRALLDLIESYVDKPVSIRDIAERQNVSLRYLENIFHDLKCEGILESTKGKNGGFIPSADIEKIPVLKIIETLEGRISVVDCTDAPKSCKKSPLCPSRTIWKKLNDRIRETLDGTTLGDLLEKQ